MPNDNFMMIVEIKNILVSNMLKICDLADMIVFLLFV